jgi:hypothetical protein
MTTYGIWTIAATPDGIWLAHWRNEAVTTYADTGEVFTGLDSAGPPPGLQRVSYVLARAILRRWAGQGKGRPE